MKTLNVFLSSNGMLLNDHVTKFLISYQDGFVDV